MPESLFNKNINFSKLIISVNNPFQPSVAFHIETSHLICIVNPSKSLLNYPRPPKFSHLSRHVLLVYKPALQFFLMHCLLLWFSLPHSHPLRLQHFLCTQWLQGPQNMDLVLTPLYQTEQGCVHVSLIDKMVTSLIITFVFILLVLPAPCILESCIKTFKASIKPFEAPQRRVKIKNKLICSLCPGSKREGLIRKSLDSMLSLHFLRPSVSSSMFSATGTA